MNETNSLLDRIVKDIDSLTKRVDQFYKLGLYRESFDLEKTLSKKSDLYFALGKMLFS